MGTSAFQAAGLIWFVIFVYALAGSVDMGATFWRMVFAHTGQREAERIADKYVSPLWEAANVFLVLIAVAIAGFFPGASFVYGTVLLLPVSAVLVLLALRGSFLAFAHAAPNPPRALWDITGVTGILLPALLITVLPISQGGFVTGGSAHPSLAYRHVLSPEMVAYVVFGAAACLFISATFLADYAHTAHAPQARAAYRRQAIWSGPLMMVAGVAAVFIDPSSLWIHQRILPEWPWFLGSLIAFGLGLLTLWWPSGGRPRWTVVLIGIQLALADIGYGIAHSPYLLYPQVPTVAGFSNEAMFADLLWVVVIGICLLAPGFVWLWRLFILDPRYTSSIAGTQERGATDAQASSSKKGSGPGQV